MKPGGARGVMVIVVGIGHGDTSFHIAPLGKVWSNYSPSSYG